MRMKEELGRCVLAFAPPPTGENERESHAVVMPRGGSVYLYSSRTTRGLAERRYQGGGLCPDAARGNLRSGDRSVYPGESARGKFTNVDRDLCGDSTTGGPGLLDPVAV